MGGVRFAHIRLGIGRGSVTFQLQIIERLLLFGDHIRQRADVRFEALALLLLQLDGVFVCVSQFYAARERGPGEDRASGKLPRNNSLGHFG